MPDFKEVAMPIEWLEYPDTHPEVFNPQSSSPSDSDLYEMFKGFIDSDDIDGAYRFIYDHPEWVQNNSALVDSLINPLIQRSNASKDLQSQRNAWINNGFSPYYLQNQNLNLFSDNGAMNLTQFFNDRKGKEYTTHEANQDLMKAISVVLGIFAIISML